MKVSFLVVLRIMSLTMLIGFTKASHKYFLKIKENKMRYLLITTVLAAFLMTACGDPKPAQYPPSLYKDFEDPLTDEDLAEVQKKGAEKRAAAEEAAEEVEEAIEDVADEAEDAVEDAVDEVEEAAEEVDSD